MRQEDNPFKEDLKIVIGNWLISHVDDYDRSELCKTYPCIKVKLGIRRGNDGELIHGREKIHAVDVDVNPIGIPNKNTLD